MIGAGNQIKTLMYKLSLNQLELAKLINVSQSSICLYLKNERIPSPKILRRIRMVAEMNKIYFSMDSIFS